jgi:hypothetical protein
LNGGWLEVHKHKKWLKMVSQSYSRVKVINISNYQYASYSISSSSFLECFLFLYIIVLIQIKNDKEWTKRQQVLVVNPRPQLSIICSMGFQVFKLNLHNVVCVKLGGDTSCVFGGPTCDGGVFLGGLFTS